jgi:hypothetical protein
MNALLAGLTILVIGDSHMAEPEYLISRLHDALAARGAVVHSYGACGLPAGDWMKKKRSMCGAATRGATGKVEVFPGKDGFTTPYAELNRALKPDLVVVVIGDAMGDYMKPEIPKAWIWQQVTALTKGIRESNTPCIWVGPPWGTGGRFGKSYERVAQYSAYLSDIVAPCRYVDSTTFSKPGDWATVDGLHFTAPGYLAWSEAIAQAVVESRK